MSWNSLGLSRPVMGLLYLYTSSTYVFVQEFKLYRKQQIDEKGFKV
jgi:hypothetical protein